MSGHGRFSNGMGGCGFCRAAVGGACFGGCGGCGGFFVFGEVAQIFQIKEFVARLPKRFGRCFAAKAIYHQTCCADAGSQRGEVAIARHQAEAAKVAAVEQIHGVNNQPYIGGIFPLGVGELLDGYQRMLEQNAAPAAQCLAAPVAVNALDAGYAVLGNFFKQTLCRSGRCVVGINEYRQLGLPHVLDCHGHCAP